MVSLGDTLHYIFQSNQDSRPIGSRGATVCKSDDSIIFLSSSLLISKNSEHYVSSCIALARLGTSEEKSTFSGITTDRNLSPSEDNRVVRVSDLTSSEKERLLFEFMVFNTKETGLDSKPSKFRNQSNSKGNKVTNTSEIANRRSFSTTRKLKDKDFKCRLLTKDDTWLEFNNLRSLLKYLDFSE